MAGAGGPPPEAAMRKGVSRGVFAIVVVVVAILAFLGGIGTGSLLAPPPAGPTKLVIGTNTPFPPFEFRNETDAVVGFDIDLIGKVMDRIGRQYELYDFRDFSALLSAVQVRRVDVAASGITSNGDIGVKRNLTMSFSNSYYEADQGVLKKASDARTLCSNANDCPPAELKDLKIAVQSGTSSEFWVEDNLPGRACGSANFTCFPDVTSALTVLKGGTVDIVIVDLPVAQRTAQQNPIDYKVAGTIQTNELYAFAVARGDPLGLLPGINQALAQFKSDGTYAALIAKWFSG